MSENEKREPGEDWEFDEREDSEDGEQPEETEPGFNYPTVYLDGTSIDNYVEGGEHYESSEVERVQVEFDSTVNGYSTDADRAAPLGWCNSAAITLARDEDAVHVSISVGDPRGAFVFTVRRVQGELIMHVPYPGQGMLHEELKELHTGTYEIGR